MKTFLIVSLCILALALPFIGIYLVENWKRLIWENKGRIFRFITDGENWFKGQPMWVVEKRFLWFWVDCSEILDKSHFFTCKEAAECLSKYLKNLTKNRTLRVTLLITINLSQTQQGSWKQEFRNKKN